MSSLNKAQIIGNLGSDPEVRSTSDGTKVATLSVATNRSWTDQHGNEQMATEWHQVVAWDRLAKVCGEYLSKGDRVYIEGRIQYREWEDDDGRTRHTTEIRVRNLIMLGSPGGGGERRSREPNARKPTREEKRVAGATEGSSTQEETVPGDALDDDGLPF
mgnify:CR=1 FL=1